jgi:hypothetical protein
MQIHRNPQASPAPVTTVSQTPAQVEDTAAAAKAIETYMEAVASADPDTQREALSSAAPDSVAAAYLQHQTNQAEAALDGGSPYDAAELNKVEDGYEIINVDDTTATFADFKTSDAKVSDFTINGRSPGKFLTVGSGDKVRGGGATFEFLTAYRSISANSLIVTVKVTSTKPITLDIYSAVYRDRNGKQRTASDADGPTELASKSNTVIALIFRGSRPGGTVTLTGSLNDFSDDYKVTIRVG